MKEHDEALWKEINGMLARYAGGEPWSAITFDLLRTKQLSIEKAYCVLMSDENFKTISLMLEVINSDDHEMRGRVFDAVSEQLKITKKQDRSLDNPDSV